MMRSIVPAVFVLVVSSAWACASAPLPEGASRGVGISVGADASLLAEAPPATAKAAEPALPPPATAPAKVVEKEPLVPPAEGVKLFDGKDMSRLYTHLRDSKYEDPRKVFTVHDGLLHLSGDGFGGVITRDAWRDYHLIYEFRWGTKTFGEREKRAKDSGILFHCTGPEDAFGGTWHEAFQAQIAQGSTGDLYAVKAEGPVELSMDVEVEERGGKPYWKKGGERRTLKRGPVFWYGKDPAWQNVVNFRGKGDVESPDGEWTRVEVICDGDHPIVKVNDVQVNEAFKLKPSAGKILVQVEGAELFIRRWDLWPVGKAPKLEPMRPAK
jgi:hypothetical protein